MKTYVKYVQNILFFMSVSGFSYCLTLFNQFLSFVDVVMGSHSRPPSVHSYATVLVKMNSTIKEPDSP
jgi:hypothetical protein